VRRGEELESELIAKWDKAAEAVESDVYKQYLLDGDTRESLARDRRLQETVLELKHKFGKNAVLKGVDLTDCATAIERNGQIGGHKSG
jgi:DNA polymerase V